MMHMNFPGHFLALTFQMSFVGGDWVYYGRYKEATHPFKTLSGDNAFCSDQCNRDALCNGYSIDTSTNGCYLSRCTSYTGVPESYDCMFASKNPPSSPDICTPTSTTKIAPATKMVTTKMYFTTTIPTKTMSAKTTTPRTTMKPTMTSTRTTITIPATTTTATTTLSTFMATTKAITSVMATINKPKTTPLTTTHFATTTTSITIKSLITTTTSAKTTTSTTIKTSTNTPTTRFLTTTPTTKATPTATTTTSKTTKISTFITSKPTTKIPWKKSTMHVSNDDSKIVINNTSCICVCTDINQTLEESIGNRRRKLTVNQLALSSAIRKLSSAPDIRVTSKVIGTVAIIILVVFGLFMFLADIISIVSLIF